MTRIVAGVLGGRRLRTPPGGGTRPTSDRVREALFSRAESLLGGLHGTETLDLYAGSGAVGLESLSRGAARTVLVESDRRVAAVARGNAAALDLTHRTEVVAGRVETVLAGPPRVVAGLVFADPPYSVATPRLRDVLGSALDGGWCTQGALLVVERPSRADPLRFPDGVEDVGERRYGETTLWYGRRA